MVNQIQISKVDIRVDDEDPEAINVTVEYYFTDTPTIPNANGPYSMRFDAFESLEALPGWPEGIDFT